MELLLEIDYREKAIKNTFTDGDGISSSSINYSIVNLEVGDFVFKIGEKIVLIIERKTTRDLLSSITDGRFRDQKTRLTMTNAPICYIIEDEKNSGDLEPREKTMYRGSIVNLLFKHNFKVLFSESVDETVNLLINIFNKIQKEEILSNGSDGSGILVSKSKLIADNMFVSQLCLIKGVSKPIAEVVVEKYKSPRELIHAYETEIRDPENLLQDLQIGKRKLGKVLSKKIYDCYMGINLEPICYF